MWGIALAALTAFGSAAASQAFCLATQRPHPEVLGEAEPRGTHHVRALPDPSPEGRAESKRSFEPGWGPPGRGEPPPRSAGADSPSPPGRDRSEKPRPGDAARGRAIVADRTRGLCLLCHSAPIPEERFQGELAPSLAGAGSRNTEAELRLRMVDSRRINPETIMPAYGRAEGFERVGTPWRGRTILSPADIEDVVAYLMTLKEEPR